jgi:hypothetical protein
VLLNVYNGIIAFFISKDKLWAWLMDCHCLVMLIAYYCLVYDRDAAAQMISNKQRSEMRKTASLSGPLSLPTRASANSLSAPIRSSGGTSVHLIITAMFIGLTTTVHRIYTLAVWHC